MKMIRTCLLLLLCFGGPVAMAQDKPNVLLIFMDNFGWGEPGFNGGGIIRGAETPTLDSLADEGLRLTNFNVEVQCTPSRSALMTGRYAIRSGNGTVPMGKGEYGLVQWEVTMAEMFSEAGYATGIAVPYVLDGEKGKSPKKARPYNLDYRPLIDRDLTDRAISFMKRQAKDDTPFFALPTQCAGPARSKRVA